MFSFSIDEYPRRNICNTIFVSNVPVEQNDGNTTASDYRCPQRRCSFFSLQSFWMKNHGRLYGRVAISRIQRGEKTFRVKYFFRVKMWLKSLLSPGLEGIVMNFEIIELFLDLSRLELAAANNTDSNAEITDSPGTRARASVRYSTTRRASQQRNPNRLSDEQNGTRVRRNSFFTPAECEAWRVASGRTAAAEITGDAAWK